MSGLVRSLWMIPPREASRRYWTCREPSLGAQRCSYSIPVDSPTYLQGKGWYQPVPENRLSSSSLGRTRPPQMVSLAPSKYCGRCWTVDFNGEALFAAHTYTATMAIRAREVATTRVRYGHG